MKMNVVGFLNLATVMPFAPTLMEVINALAILGIPVMDSIVLPQVQCQYITKIHIERLREF